MKLAVAVHNHGDGALAVAVAFNEWHAPEASRTFTSRVADVDTPAHGELDLRALLLQPNATALGAGLRQPDAIRARLVCGSRQASQFVTGYGIRIPGARSVARWARHRPSELSGLGQHQITRQLRASGSTSSMVRMRELAERPVRSRHSGGPLPDSARSSSAECRPPAVAVRRGWRIGPLHARLYPAVEAEGEQMPVRQPGMFSNWGSGSGATHFSRRLVNISTKGSIPSALSKLPSWTNVRPGKLSSLVEKTLEPHAGQ